MYEKCRICKTEYPIWIESCPICDRLEKELEGHIGYFDKTFKWTCLPSCPECNSKQRVINYLSEIDEIIYEVNITNRREFL